MANYVFETLTQAQAAGFTSNDYLIFINGTTSATSISVSSADATGLTNSSITLTAGTQSLTFPADELSGASTAGQLVFNDGSSLLLGLSGNDNAGFGGTAGNDVIYGLGGDDTIGGAGGGNDYLYGGTGADVITSGAGNDHIYGNQLGSVQGETDGNDSISAGDGGDYVNGNAGNDTINGEAGSDRLFGGAGNDVINGGTGNDSINGNTGNDSISGGDGNDALRGGQGDDTVAGGIGDDVIQGDLGDDSIVGGVGIDVLNGGAGVDTFSFSGTDAAYATSGASAYVTDIITDYTDGTDKIALNFTGGAVDLVLKAQAGVTFADGAFAAAITYAQQLLTADGTANDVVALNVGSDAYLFYNGTGVVGSIDSIIHLQGVDASVINTSDFV